MSDNLRFNNRIVKIDLWVNSDADTRALASAIVQLAQSCDGGAAFAIGNAYDGKQGKNLWHQIRNRVDDDKREDTLVTLAPVPKPVAQVSAPEHVEREYYMLWNKKTKQWHNYGATKQWTEEHEGGYVWTNGHNAKLFAESFPKDIFDMEVVPVSMSVKK